MDSESQVAGRQESRRIRLPTHGRTCPSLGDLATSARWECQGDRSRGGRVHGRGSRILSQAGVPYLAASRIGDAPTNTRVQAYP